MQKLLLVSILIFNSLSAQITSRTKIQMGTFITISLDEKDAHYMENGFELISRVELALSSYDKNAQIYKLNKNRETSINSYTYNALRLSQKYYEQSDGYFDITIGSITKDLYRFGEEEKVPSQNELSNAKIDFKGIYFSKNRASLEDGIKVDLGGMGKGFSVDVVSDYFIEKNISMGTISASGDIRCLDICSINIQDPFSNKALLRFKTVHENSSISTSGNYNRYVKNTKYNHLINPKTKKSQTKFISITLISQLPNSDLDAYATTASVMPIKKAYEFLDAFDLVYVVLQSDGELVLSKNIELFTQKLFINYTKK